MNKLFMFLLTFLGVNIDTPVRLQKNLSFKEKLVNWWLDHQFILLLVGICLMWIFLVIFVFMFVWPLESGNVYNHMFEVI